MAENKIRPFTCLFCNKLIENDTEYGHITNCGSVLEPCINKCGSYVPRNMKSKHLRECKNRISRSMMQLPITENEIQDTARMSPMLPPYSNTNSLGRIKVKQEPSHLLHPPDFNQLTNKFQYLDHICKQLSQSVFAFKTKYQENLQMQQNVHTNIQMNFEKLKYQSQIISEWKRNIELQQQNLTQEMKTFQKFQNESEIRLVNLERQYELSKKIESSLKEIQENHHQEQLQNREAHIDVHEKLNELKDYVTEQNAVVGALWNDQKMYIDKLLKDTEDINRVLNENKTKFGSWVFDLRTTSQIATETSDKLEIQERIIENFKKELAQLNVDFKCLEEHFLTQSSKQDWSIPGHCLWKIKDFNEKFKYSKENDVILKGPIFYSHMYGYRIRLEVYLNGIKKWKGRHMIASLRVLKGEHDLLLKWPCHIEGTVTIRDVYNQTNPDDFSKYISAKRHSPDEETEEPQESSPQYIFVTHTILTKQNFIKSDTMFIEININSVNKLSKETDL